MNGSIGLFYTQKKLQLTRLKLSGSCGDIKQSYYTLFLSPFPNYLSGFEATNTHLDFRRKNFDFMDDFFLVFPFTALQMMASSTAKSHFNLDFCDFDVPKSMPSLDFLVTFDDCSCCCFFEVVKFCKKLNITLRVIAQPAPLGFNNSSIQIVWHFILFTMIWYKMFRVLFDFLI